MYKSIIQFSVLIGLLILAGVGLHYANDARALATGELYGYVCNVPGARNIGCISLDSTYALPAYVSSGGHQVYFDTLSQLLSGRGYSPRVGYVDFGQTCPSSIVSIVGSRAIGAKCARAESALSSGTAGWNGWLYTGDVSYVPGSSTPRRDTLSGYGWEGWNIDNAASPSVPDVGMGWFDFSTAFIAIPGCTNPADTVHYNANATVDDGSCDPIIPPPIVCVLPEVYDPITDSCIIPSGSGSGGPIIPHYKET